MCAKSFQLCLTLCMDKGSLLDFSVHGILQARILEWIAISLRAVPNSGIQPGSPAFQTGSLPSEPRGKPIVTVYLISESNINVC